MTAPRRPSPYGVPLSPQRLPSPKLSVNRNEHLALVVAHEHLLALLHHANWSDTGVADSLAADLRRLAVGLATRPTARQCSTSSSYSKSRRTPPPSQAPNRDPNKLYRSEACEV